MTDENTQPQPPAAADVVKCTYAGCSEPAWSPSAAGRCLYHARENGCDKETARLVWEHARRLASDPAGCTYSGWHFPDDPDERLFTGVVFQSDALFYGAMFAGQAGFLAARFRGAALFDNAIFAGDAWFINAVFESDARFHGVRFQADVDFESALFHGRAWFGNCSSQEGREVQFDLPSIELPLVPPRPFVRREEGETAYRLGKQAANSRGDYRLAGQCHYAEQSAHEFGNRKRVGTRPWRFDFWKCLLELVFARWVFGYGEKPQRALLAGLVVILAMSVIFLTMGGVAPGGMGDAQRAVYSPSFWECLHFSAVTFTTVGYGDLTPKPEAWPLADAEAFLGAALMALFVVGLARQYMR